MNAMLRLAILSGGLLLLSCAPVGVATREPGPASSGRTLAASPAAKMNPPAAVPEGAPLTPAVPASDDAAYYRQMVPVLEAKDLAAAKAIDFARFRHGSMLLRHGGGPAAEKDLRPALTSGDVAAIRRAASALVAEDAAHIGAHIILMNIDQDAGHTTDAELHDAFIAGMFHSMFASGDGRGYTTAIRAYFIREEYDLVRALGGQVQRQSLGHQDGKSYDILQVKTKSGATRDIYFDITELFAEEGKLFGLPAPKGK